MYALVHYPDIDTPSIHQFRMKYEPRVELMAPHLTITLHAETGSEILRSMQPWNHRCTGVGNGKERIPSVGIICLQPVRQRYSISCPTPVYLLVNPFSIRRLPLSMFGSDPLSFFNAVYEDIPPWDIGKPQPAMSALLARYPPTSPILDVGCGSGDLSIYLAELGYETLGIDFVEAAIADAKEKIRSLPPETARLVSFQVADALKPSLLGRQFGAIVDSGFFHLFDPDQCARYVDELASTLPPGGLYYIHAFAIEFPIASMPRQITAEEIRGRFTAEQGWQIKEIQAVEFLSRVAPPVPAICACIERLPAKAPCCTDRGKDY